MCFSATASFTAAAVLSLQGLATINLVKKHKSFLLLAIIPLLFAIQQFSEGMVWHYFNQNLPIEGIAAFFAKIFLSFAFLIWPFLFALSLWAAEPVQWKKKWLFLFFIFGVIWSLYLLSFVPFVDLIVKKKELGLLYSTSQYNMPAMNIMRWVYLGLLVIPIFLSSLRYMWIFGLFVILSAILTHHFYAETFTSVWCFFGALLSLMLYFILKANIQTKTAI